MIEINLLPESLREVEHTPWPRLITFLVGLILFLLTSYVASREYFFEMTEIKSQISAIENFLNSESTKKGKERVSKLENDIKDKKQRKETLLAIANAKTMWCKRLDMLNATVNEKFTKNLWFDGITVSPMQKPDFLKSNIPITMKLTTKGHLMLKMDDSVGTNIATVHTHLKETFKNEIDEVKFKIASYTVIENKEINKKIVDFPLEITFLPKIYLPPEQKKK